MDKHLVAVPRLHDDVVSRIEVESVDVRRRRWRPPHGIKRCSTHRLRSLTVAVVGGGERQKYIYRYRYICISMYICSCESGPRGPTFFFATFVLLDSMTRIEVGVYAYRSIIGR